MAVKQRKIAAIYEVDDQNFMNIMGGPHYNIVDVSDYEVIATVWIDDDADKCKKDALLLAAAEDLLRAADAALKWAHDQDDAYAPAWIRSLSKAAQKAKEGDKHTELCHE
jgi:hypothetical protein